MPIYQIIPLAGIDSRSRQARYVGNLSQIDPRRFAAGSAAAQLEGVFAGDTRRCAFEERRGGGCLRNAIPCANGKDFVRDRPTHHS